MCKALLAAHKARAPAPADPPPAAAPAASVPPALVAACARQALATILAAGSGGGRSAVWDAARARACAALLEAEALPQAARWHRRDLVPALLAAWAAVRRALARRAAPAPLPPGGGAPAS